MEAEKRNYYEVLDIEVNATPDQIETAYVRARNAYSGDSVALYSLMTRDECDNILSQIEEAYSVIGFPEKRREYDKLRGFNVGAASSLTQRASAPQMTQPQQQQPQPPQANFQYENFGSNLNEAKVSKIAAQKKFGLEYEEDAQLEEKIRDCIEFTGLFLKEIREYKKVTVERMAEMTRISKTHIKALENEESGRLPADVYVRGYVYQYAKVLKLNPDQVANSYILHFKKLKSQK